MTKRNRRGTRGSPCDEKDSGVRAEVTEEGDGHGNPTRRTFAVQLTIVVCAALLLRILNVLQTASVPSVVHPVGDSAGYLRWGAEIAAGEWFGNETFYQAPLYPYFLALLMKVFGAGVPGIRVVQAMLGSVGVLLVGFTARNLFNQRVGIIAAIMIAVYPAAIYYDAIIQKTSLASALLCGLLAACSWLPRKWGAWTAATTGVLLGLLVLTRENALLWLPVIPIWMLLATKHEPGRMRIRVVGCFVLGAATVLVPVAARNAWLGGEWSPTTFQAGPNFYIGNNLQAYGIYQPLVPGRETPVFERADAQRLAEEAEGRDLSAREVSRYWINRTFDEIRDDPMRWMQLLVQKSFMVINHFEVPDVESMFIYRKVSVPLKVASLWHFGVLCPLAVLGATALVRQRDLWLFYVLIASMIAAVVLFYILGRYRFPLVPLMIPFAAAGVYQLWNCTLSKQLATLKYPLAIAACFAVLCNLPVHDRDGLNATSIMNVGIAAARNGDIPTAIRLLSEAVELQPSIAEAHFNLGRAWSAAGRPDMAMTSYQNALQLDPSLVAAIYFLAQSLEELDQLDAALRYYRHAMETGVFREEAIRAVNRLTAAAESQSSRPNP